MIRGQWQLQKLSVFHCRTQGSSRGVREFIDTRLPAFASQNPQLSVDTVHRNNRHPFVQAEYVNGLVKAVDLRNVAAVDVLSVCQSLRNQSGRPIRGKWSGARGSVASVQGKWTPAFNFIDPIQQMRREVDKQTALVGIAPPISAASKVPPPPIPYVTPSSTSSPSAALRPNPRPSSSAPLPLSVKSRQPQQQRGSP